MSAQSDEERPLLEHNGDHNGPPREDQRQRIQFGENDDDDPRAWSAKKKFSNVAIIALMALLSPLASSMFTPGISQIAQDLDCTQQAVIATTTGYVVALGIGPLVLAPLSETFGRRQVYIWCFAVFTLLQIPAALAPNIILLIVVRTISGFFGSVAIANGGGNISDMFVPSNRASVFGWYLLGPLLGPTIGPLFGGIIVTELGWRWVYWILLIVSAVVTVVGYFGLRETYAPVLLHQRKVQMSNSHENGASSKGYYFEGEDERPLHTKLWDSMQRPVVIFIQPIVLTMSFYQALIFGTTYSIYTNMQEIFSKPPYDFDSEQVGLLYLGPGLGFLTAVWFLVPRIDDIYNKLTEKNGGKALPEYRLPLANLGAVIIPVSLFWFAWSVEARLHWAISITATFFYCMGQVTIMNTVQNYYIDSFSRYAASAIAGGSVFRSLVGGVVPLFSPMLFEQVGYGWGISVFAFLTVAIAPAPIVFYMWGGQLREKFPLSLT